MTAVTITKWDGTTEEIDVTFPYYMRIKEPQPFASILSFELRVEEDGTAVTVMAQSQNGDQIIVNTMVHPDPDSFISIYYYDTMYEVAPDSTTFDAALAVALDRINIAP